MRKEEAVMRRRTSSEREISKAAASRLASSRKPAAFPLPQSQMESQSSSQSANKTLFFAMAQMWSGRVTCRSTSASTSDGEVSEIRALGERTMRWAHTSANTSVTSSGST